MCGARPRQLRNSAPAPELPSMGQARLPPHRTGDSHSMAWLCSRRVRGQPRGPSCMCAMASPSASKDERNPRLAQPPAGLRLQEQVHDAASDTDTRAQPPWLLPGTELRKTIICEALCLQRRVSLGRRGEAGSSLKLLHQTREGHTTNLLWKLATERSPGHQGQEREKRTRVLLEQTGSSLDGAQHTPPCATCPSVPYPCAALQEQSLAQSLFYSRGRGIRNVSIQTLNL